MRERNIRSLSVLVRFSMAWFYKVAKGVCISGIGVVLTEIRGRHDQLMPHDRQFPMRKERQRPFRERRSTFRHRQACREYGEVLFNSGKMVGNTGNLLGKTGNVV